jgi:predicted molibdopterin-dependent oxidoreductase YjgC
LNRSNVKGNKPTYKTATIDGFSVKVRPDLTILDAAIKAGIYIPTLCHLEVLDAYGGCRLCAVEVKNMRGYPTACTTPLEPGMEVVTVSPALQKLRREILEFTLSEHPFTCLVCKDKKECTDFMHSTRKVSTITGCNFCTSNGDCELQELVEYLELDDIKFPITYRGIPPVRDNPFYDLDYNLCVLCGRCVRICNEERNSHVLAFVERGNSTIVGTAFGDSQAKAGCEFCGACVDVCPTGSISEKLGKWRGKPDRSVKTTCTICPLACDMNVNSKAGKLVQIGPAPGRRIDPPQLCLKGKFLPAEICDHPSRITAPLIKKENKWIEVSWKKAIDTIALQLDKHRGNNFGVFASAQDTLEDNFQVQKFTRQVMLSNNLDLHHSYPSREIPAMIHQLRIEQLTAALDDMEKADTLLLLGSDASVSHPLLENLIRKAYRKGKQVINLAACSSRSSTFSTLEVLYGPGEEVSMLQLLISALGKKSDPKDNTLPLEKVIPLLKASGNMVILAGDELLRQSSSGNIFNLLSRLRSILYSTGRCSILFPGFEGNLYAGALMGVHPDYQPGFKKVRSKDRGLTGREMLGNMGKNGVRALMVIGDLPPHYGLNQLEFLVQFNMFRTELSEQADVLLPLAHFLENEGHILSIDHKIKKLNQALIQPEQAQSISSILALLARAMGSRGFSRQPAAVFRELHPMIRISEQDRADRGQRGIKQPSEEDARGGDRRNKGYPVHLIIQHNHYRYRGNVISKLVPELNSISGEEMLGLPGSLMKELKVKAGDRVRIITEQGEMKSVIRSVEGLKSGTACFIPNGNLPSGIQDEIHSGNRVINIKIEKV